MTISDLSKEQGVPCPTLDGRLQDIEKGLFALSIIAKSLEADNEAAVQFIHDSLWEHVMAARAAYATEFPSTGTVRDKIIAAPTIYND